MHKEILINIEEQEKRVAIVKDGRLQEFYIERPQDKTIVGNIYKGRIEAVMPSIGAAFVDIGLNKKGFLYLSEIDSNYELSDNAVFSAKKVEKGQEVLVQVVKESFGNKGPRLSCHIGIAGRYIVLMPQDSQIGVSRRIEDDEERKRLRSILAEIKLPKGVGFIVRTAAWGKSKQELQRDAYFLIKLWKRIERIIQARKSPALIYEEYDLVFRVIRDSFSDDVDKLIVDSKNEFIRIKRFMKAFMNYLNSKVDLYRGEDLFLDKDIEKQINRIFDAKVYLKSKAYLVIEPTEGLVVIDVNSGGFKRNIQQEEAAFKVNCEAAEEVARQLVLRDLGGIIVIDFIDMQRENHRREVLNTLKRALSNDRAKYDILGISKFGLVEMTRERIHNTVQTMTFQNCPYCNGKGKIRSVLTISISAMKELKKALKVMKPQKDRQLNLKLNSLVAEEVLRNKNSLRYLENKFRTKINLIPDPSMHIEEVSIY
ncbi:MAG: Rne/Rng family ribonuclease [Candidatus Omnitrophota bacterium]|jgi:ribonuclease G|nr:MAG: Rne/Rng family ribonuclease [Candidatus Omnitrophota bacterium]